MAKKKKKNNQKFVNLDDYLANEASNKDVEEKEEKEIKNNERVSNKDEAPSPEEVGRETDNRQTIMEQAPNPNEDKIEDVKEEAINEEKLEDIKEEDLESKEDIKVEDSIKEEKIEDKKEETVKEERESINNSPLYKEDNNTNTTNTDENEKESIVNKPVEEENNYPRESELNENNRESVDLPRESEVVGSNKSHSNIEEPKSEEVKAEETFKEEEIYNMADPTTRLKVETDKVNAEYGTNFDVDSDNKIANNFKKIAEKNSNPEKQKKQFDKEFKKLCSDTLTNIFKAQAKARNEGKDSKIADVTIDAHNIIRASFEYCKSQNEAFKNYEFTPYGGLSAKEIYNLQIKNGYKQLNKDLQTADEKKNLEEFKRFDIYAAFKDDPVKEEKKEEVKKEETKPEVDNKKLEEAKENFKSEVEKLNDDLGTKFKTEPSKKTDKAFEDIAKNPDKAVQKRLFDAAFKKVSSDALAAMFKAQAESRNKGNESSISDATYSANNLLKATFEYCKAKDPAFKDYEYTPYGGLNSKEINRLQLDYGYDNLRKDLRTDEEIKSLHEAMQNDNFFKTKDQIEKENAQKEAEKNDPVKREQEIKSSKERLEHQIEVYNTATKSKYAMNPENGIADSYKKIASLSPELRKQQFEKQFKEFSREFLSHSLNSATRKRNKGDLVTTTGDITKQAEIVMKANFDYLKSLDPAFSDYEYKSFGGLDPKEVRDIQMTNGFNNVKPNVRSNKEKNEINSMYSTNVTLADKNAHENLSTSTDYLNKRYGLKMSPEGIETYFKNRWKECEGKNVDAQQAMFQREYREFCEKAYQHIMSKNTEKTDLQNQLAEFDKFTSDIENLCKNNGWMDKNSEHELFGGMNSNTIRTIQANKLKTEPTKAEEWAKNKAEEITGIKEEKQEEAERNKAAAEKGYGKLRKNFNKFIDSISEDAETAKQKEDKRNKNFDKTIKNIIKNIPKKGESLDDINLKNAVDLAKNLEAICAQRSGWWKFRNKDQYEKEMGAVQNILNALEKNGYNKDDINTISHNPITEDMVKNDFNKQKNSVDQIYERNEKLFKEQTELIENGIQVTNDKIQITVPEADNTKEITNPDIKAPFRNLETEKKLEAQNQKTTTEVNND